MVAARYQTAFRLYPYRRVADQGAAARRHPVVIVGGGPVGLTLALDLGQRGTPVLLLDDHEGPGQGSKAICFAKRTLDIAHRLGAGAAMVDKGVVWNVGRVFHAEGELFSFDLLPSEGHRHPAFINLQQPHFERFLHEAIERAQADGAPIEIRGGNRVTGLVTDDDGATLTVDTPDGPYEVAARYLIACDGARSPLRDMMGLGFAGRVFEDNFLIADVRMKAEFPTERWFWFAPPFKDSGQSALLHKQPDDIWRIDFQLGWDIDRDAELDEARIRARVDAMLSSQTGQVPDYDLVWTSIYTFQCRRMERFRHGPVLFAGDSAHQVSPFGARGANSGVQDADNLGWKLDLVRRGLADDGLLDGYATEREVAADENILNSSRATDFMTPKTGASRLFRDAVLDLAGKHPFARPLVNSGRLSVPCTYDGLPGFGPDATGGPALSRPGAACPDGPVEDGFLLDHLGGDFVLLALGGPAPKPVSAHGITPRILHLPRVSCALAHRYLGDAETALYLIRPDQHVVARWPDFDPGAVAAALSRALGKA
ncbi:FAD-dependent oxidoreductase [Jannaschia pohangensis]|uniref:3-(3-hydroxy-phenyl)propionate hydroxylase n=1 Tax=Jannaschia pohangensis TaxID=390807 RepID=A0A1I3HG83_9RHOB|nr:FAD-dependent oxidoreductase [Jannaschia pohangensis]SFI34714.1 3-(3-hydroxy-phenyl)propionate hydroxylase [Jannaschia pohangensis]